MHTRHSPALKRFIYLLIAMMVFSAVGVMVVYLNIPATTTPTDTATTTGSTTTGQQLVTIPGLEPTLGATGTTTGVTEEEINN